MKRLIVHGDIVYVLEVIEAPRNVNPKASRKANELIVFGFNKRFHPELYEKYLMEVQKNAKKETNQMAHSSHRNHPNAPDSIKVYRVD